MPKLILTLLLPLTLAACAQEVVAVHDSSLASQFTQLNKNGWAVARSDQNQTGRSSNDPNVRVIHEANWSNLKFNTNFQVDDPQLRAQLDHQNQQNQQNVPPSQAAPSQPNLNPFGATPVTPPVAPGQ